MSRCVNLFTQHVDRVVTPQMNVELLRPFTCEEICIALFQNHPSKAPGLDGMTFLFFQKYRSIVGKDVCETVLDCLNFGRVLNSPNLTHLALIPKVKSPEHLSQFQPISLCNVLYKIISKLLANKLKVIMPSIISDSQSAFVPGRLTSENVLVAFEMLHSLKNRRKGRKKFMVVKLDMSKAYDRV